MSNPRDRAYYVKRIAEEHARATSATDGAAAAAHREMAGLYQQRLENKSSERPALVLVTG